MYFLNIPLHFSKDPAGFDLIDIEKKPSSANSKRRKAEQQRAKERDREREYTRRQTQHQNMFAFVKQMKTVQFSLASQRYFQFSIPNPEPTRLIVAYG